MTRVPKADDEHIDGASVLRLNEKIKRWEYVELELMNRTALEVHVRAIAAALIVLADVFDERGKWGGS